MLRRRHARVSTTRKNAMRLASTSGAATEAAPAVVPTQLHTRTNMGFSCASDILSTIASIASMTRPSTHETVAAGIFAAFLTRNSRAWEEGGEGEG